MYHSSQYNMCSYAVINNCPCVGVYNKSVHWSSPNKFIGLTNRTT